MTFIDLKDHPSTCHASHVVFIMPKEFIGIDLIQRARVSNDANKKAMFMDQNSSLILDWAL